MAVVPEYLLNVSKNEVAVQVLLGFINSVEAGTIEVIESKLDHNMTYSELKVEFKSKALEISEIDKLKAENASLRRALDDIRGISSVQLRDGLE